MLEFFNTIFESPGELLVVMGDLFIVYYLVYISLLLIRGTRTVPMAIGLLLLVLLYTFSRALGLVTTFMLLDQFMSVVVIFTLIIFQDDIRRALVRFGKFAWISKAKETAVLEEVVRTASLLASKKIGALIVFERNASVNDFIIEEGTKLEAKVSRELLYAIFIPKMENPLHDGAAVIKNFQILEAGAFLPLTSNTKIDKTLGTRHRAALGITEETDAVAVVVSEERGSISLCFEGEIIRDLDGAALRKELLVLFSTENKEESESSTPLRVAKKKHKKTKN